MTGIDAVFLSYDEPMANSLHSRLQRTLGGTVKRLHGVHGMRRSYRLCAEVVEREQLAAWARHYRWLGIIPTGTSTGPWHEHTNTQLRDALRHRAGPGWHLLADADEFQQYPAPLNEVIAQAEKATRERSSSPPRRHRLLRQPPLSGAPAGRGPHLCGSPFQVALGRPGRPPPPRPALQLRHLAGTHPGRPRRVRPSTGPGRPARRCDQHQ
ncbi:hypothetical protein [Streptomyces sp. WMMC940]|uniref:hypothetical protein n=1 Tax=Streptomyces sp. WMMC940 TaxID=3015153 RepID=UPI0022B6F3DC|nr:hypothetical protein [Streptomyces sp. WMMC940]MCZ7460643.1 hypothetical protein [Streptomyces sp. WMMC940]